MHAVCHSKHQANVMKNLPSYETQQMLQSSIHEPTSQHVTLRLKFALISDLLWLSFMADKTERRRRREGAVRQLNTLAQEFAIETVKI